MRQHLTSIVAIDRHGAIGCKNQLPWSIKSDLAFFRRTTLGNTVIMGRKTYDSIGGCLKGRNNLVLSHSTFLFESTDTCHLVNSVDEALAVGLKVDSNESFVVGGAATYREFSALVDRYIVTMVDHEAAGADAFLSQEILQEFASWQTEEIGRFPMEIGRDEFAFRILRFDAPDAHERRERRKAIAANHIGKLPGQTHKRHASRRLANPGTQAAFSF